MNSLKRSVFEASLATTKKILVFIVPGGDLRMPGAAFLDEKGASKGYAFLEYGLQMAIPITDLQVEHDGIHATLSFPYGAEETFVPWGNVGMIGIPGTGFASVWSNMDPGALAVLEKGVPARPTLKLV